MAGEIRIGVGGWVYAPWRGAFYPPGLRQADELAHASRRVTTIEINGTFYGAQKPESFRRWREETPDDFVFSVKGPRYATHRRVLAEAGPSVERFFAGGVRELGPKLGPVLWQFMPSTRFERDDFAAFLDLLPRDAKHVVEVRHESFADEAFFALLAERGVAVATVEDEALPMLERATARFAYLRLRRAREAEPAGYTEAELDAWAARLDALAQAGDVFAYVINGAKVRAPAAAMALLARLSGESRGDAAMPQPGDRKTQKDRRSAESDRGRAGRAGESAPPPGAGGQRNRGATLKTRTETTTPRTTGGHRATSGKSKRTS